MYKEKPGLRWEFTQKEIEKLARERELSRCRGELCLVESESAIICIPCTPRNFNIYVAGQDVEYDKYWKSIIKGFSLLIECKTFAQVIGRLLYECSWLHRNQGQYVEGFKIKSVKNIQRELSVISNLLSSVRLTSISSNIARATYVRDKLEAFIEVVGLQGILKNIEKDYDEINKSVSSSMDALRNGIIFWISILMIPLTIISVIENPCILGWIITILPVLGIWGFIRYTDLWNKICTLCNRFKEKH